MRIFLVVLMLVLVPSVAISVELTKTDMYWMTQNIYHEARGESILGQIMVGFVTLERLHDGRWGNTVKKVVTSKKQFSWYWDGKSDFPSDELAWNRCSLSAQLTVKLFNVFGGDSGITHYHDSKVDPKWNKYMDPVLVVGGHIFYKE